MSIRLYPLDVCPFYTVVHKIYVIHKMICYKQDFAYTFFFDGFFFSHISVERQFAVALSFNKFQIKCMFPWIHRGKKMKHTHCMLSRFQCDFCFSDSISVFLSIRCVYPKFVSFRNIYELSVNAINIVHNIHLKMAFTGRIKNVFFMY